MSAIFQINFRREAFRRERAEARRRALGLGIWLTYFGALAVLLGLYGLNCAELNARTRQLQRQMVRQRVLQRGDAEWIASAAEAATAEPWVTDVGDWRDVLGRLPRLLPAGARLTLVQFNPEEVSGGARKLLLFGVLRADSTQDGMARVTDFVGVLAKDSLVAAHYRSVRLLSTRSQDGKSGAEFQVECK